MVITRIKMWFDFPLACCHQKNIDKKFLILAQYRVENKLPNFVREILGLARGDCGGYFQVPSRLAKPANLNKDTTNKASI